MQSVFFSSTGPTIRNIGNRIAEAMLPLLTTFDNLHQILRRTYESMIGSCGDLIGVASGIAGIGALLYISYRVWQSLARAEPIDVFPLLRPFAIGIAIMFFQPLVLTPLNGVLSPITVGCHELMKGQTFDMNSFQKKKDRMEAENDARRYMQTYMASDPLMDKELEQIVQWDQTDLAAMSAMFERHNNWSLLGIFKNIFRWLLEFVFEIASLILDTVRTFYLIVLAILGPIVFAISVFDGFQNSMIQWFGKYVSVYLWLPIADLFGAILAKIQVMSLERDIEQMEINPLYFIDGSNSIYLAFLVIGIIGYFTIPSIATWVVQTSGFGGYNRQIARTGLSITNYAASFAGATMGNIWGRISGNSGSGGNGGAKGTQSGSGGSGSQSGTAKASSSSGSPK